MLSQTKTIAFFMLVNVVHSLPKTLLDWPADIKAQYDLQFPLATNKDPSIPRKTNTGVKAGAGNGNKGHGRRLDNFVFRGPMKFYHYARLYKKVLRNQWIINRLGPANEYPVDGPTQSILARLGFGRLNVPVWGMGKQRKCCAICEDKRLAAELYVTELLTVGDQVRERGRVLLECPEGHYADLVQVNDQREIPDAHMLTIYEDLNMLDSTFHGESDYPSTFLIPVLERPREDPIYQCVCREDETKKRKAELATIQCSDFDDLFVFEDLMGYKRQNTGSSSSMSPEIENTINQWTNFKQNPLGAVMLVATVASYRSTSSRKVY